MWVWVRMVHACGCMPEDQAKLFTTSCAVLPACRRGFTLSRWSIEITSRVRPLLVSVRSPGDSRCCSWLQRGQQDTGRAPLAAPVGGGAGAGRVARRGWRVATHPAPHPSELERLPVRLPAWPRVPETRRWRAS